MRWRQVRVTSPRTDADATHEDLVQATATTSDRAHLARAVAMAERARGISSPNPAVGCVLVRDDAVVGEGATSPVGGPHAEINALSEAGERARGATAYVTLEPCGHHGRTPPCANALRDAGVRRVVYGLDDPNPVARGGGAALRAAGVQVEGGVLDDWITCQLEGFLTAVSEQRPHLTLKLAHTVDGRLSVDDAPNEEDGTRRRWVTAVPARRAVHVWRAAVDAVLVGSGTVLSDDPRLDVRHVPVRGAQPRAVVLDTRLRTPETARICRAGSVVVTGPEPDAARAAALRARGVDVQAIGLDVDGRLDLRLAMARLLELGITSVLAEPGATLADGLVRAGMVDRLVSHVALDLGDGAVRLPVEGPACGPWELERLGGAGRDLILHLVPRRTATTHRTQTAAAQRAQTATTQRSQTAAAHRAEEA